MGRHILSVQRRVQQTLAAKEAEKASCSPDSMPSSIGAPDIPSCPWLGEVRRGAMWQSSLDRMPDTKGSPQTCCCFVLLKVSFIEGRTAFTRAHLQKPVAPHPLLPTATQSPPSLFLPHTGPSLELVEENRLLVCSSHCVLRLSVAAPSPS